MKTISKSVGHGGVNNEEDVETVQELLNSFPGTKLKVDGDAGAKTIARIKKFQQTVMGMHAPDGRIDPDGKTFKRLSTPSIAMQPSSQALDLLKSIEELAIKPYDDQTGDEITEWCKGATIGYGHLIAKGDWAKYKDGITETEAVSLFSSDLAPFVQLVNGALQTRVSQQQFDALLIFSYNIGPAFKGSSVLKLVNDPKAKTEHPDLESAWLAWNKSQGKVMKGLTRRRQAEYRIYSEGIYKKW